MNEENMMYDDTLQTTRSKSAFSGTSNETNRPSSDVVSQIVEPSVVLLDNLPETPLRATKYMRTFALLIPKKIIPEHRRTDIIEVRIVRTAESSKEYLLYTTHRLGKNRAYLNLFQTNPSYGELFFVNGLRVYQPSSFVEDYNSAKPMGLENTALDFDEHVQMSVGDRDVRVAYGGMRTYQGQAVMQLELGEAGPLKIAKSVEGFKMRLADHSPVTSFNEINGGVFLTYARTFHDRYLHRRTVIAPSLNQTSRVSGILPEDLILSVVGKPAGGEGRYVVRTDQRTLEKITRALAEAQDDLDLYRETKGEIAEEIIKRLLTEFGMTFVKDHPLAPPWWPSNSRRPGPDLLTRLVSTGVFAYVESKWWNKPKPAIRDAVVQLLKYLKRRPPEGIPVKIGYAAIVDWAANSEEFGIHFQRVKRHLRR